MSATHAATVYASVDDVLGAPEGRFFGAGYRRIAQRLDVIQVRDGYASATARVSCPPDWSTKRGVRQDAHLSTLDALSISAKLAVRALALQAGGAGPALHVRRISLRAGRAPVADLDQVPVGSQMIRQPDSSWQIATTVAGMKCAFEVCPGPSGCGGNDASLAGFAGEYQARTHLITDVDVDLAGGETAATSTTVLAGQPVRPAVLDTVIVIAQLAQVQLYAFDRLTRGSTHNLWMRRLDVDVPGEAGRAGQAPASPGRGRAASPCLGARASILKAGLTRMDGCLWRTVRMSGQHGDVRLSYSLAHRIG